MHDLVLESFVDLRKSADIPRTYWFEASWFEAACFIEYQLERWNSQGSINMSAMHGSFHRKADELCETRMNDDGLKCDLVLRLR